jgi:PAS domain S-box-containing protein
MKVEAARRRLPSGPSSAEVAPAAQSSRLDAGAVRALLALSSDAVLVVQHRDRRILEVSPSAERLYGQRAESMRGRPYADVVADTAAVDDLFERHREHVPLRYHQRSDGSRFPVELHIHWSEGEAGGSELGYLRVQDLSLREAEERKLKAAQASYQAIFRASPFPLLLLDRRGCVSDANEAALALYRHSAASMLGLPVASLLKDARGTRSWFRAPHFSASGQVHLRGDSDTFLADVEVSSVRLSDKVHAIVVVRDVTESLALLERLRNSEARWRFAIEGHGDLLWEWDLVEHRFQISGNLPIFSHQPDLIRDHDPAIWGERVHPADRGRLRRAFIDHFKGVTPLIDVEVRLCVAQEPDRWVWLRGRVVEHGSSGRALRLLGSVRDVHDQKQQAEELARWREQVLHTSRVTGMGEMAATLAHELNQPLTSIRNFSAAALRQLDVVLPTRVSGEAPSSLRRAVQLIADEAMRAGRILHHIHSFARKGSRRQELVSLNDLVAGFQRFAEMQASRAGVQIDLKLSVGLPRVRVDPVLIEQLLFNLVRNGVEAMTVVPARRNPDQVVPAEGQRIEIATAQGLPGEVELRVADRGRGLPQERVENIYAPFVSSKPDGMGMGLAICRSIVESHHGRLWATPRPGGGTVFHVGLPAVKEAAVADGADAEPTLEPLPQEIPLVRSSAPARTETSPSRRTRRRSPTVAPESLERTLSDTAGDRP